MKENEILVKAIQQFNNITGAGFTLLNRNQLIKNDTDNADALLELKQGATKTIFFVEIKNEIREQNLPAILNRMGKNAAEWLLVCQYIPKPLKEKLKDQGINYLETAGNCFIKKDGLFFYINDKAVTALRQPTEGKLWKQAGLKFLFGILINPELLNTNYRQIARDTKVALGNIGPFIDELKQEGFLKEGVESARPMLFVENKEQLQRKWIELFNAVLKPKLKMGRFRFIDNNLLTNWKDIPNNHFYWGAEPAGALLTNFLQPEIFTIYTKGNKTEIMKQLRLIPDKNGNVEMMDIFWETPTPDFLDKKNKTVPPLLAYAELLTSLDSRNRETAERIKQKYLA
ncbi:MAG: type IV toxin-antitoxin system AbiEi family antitoxin [Ferruginibacter sp.]